MDSDLTSKKQREVRVIEVGMELIPDDERVYPEWRRIVLQHRVVGVQVHDARLVAIMQVHRLRHVLILNTEDFKRYDTVVAVHPSQVQRF